MLRYLLVFILFLFLAGCTRPSSNSESLAHIDVELGLNDLANHDSIAAKQEILQALALDPDALVESAWGYYLKSIGDNVNAAVAYHDALTLAPNDPQIQDDYAVFLYDMGEYQLALNYFLQAAHDENYLYSDLAYENASLAAAKLGELQLAQQYHHLAVLAGY